MLIMSLIVIYIYDLKDDTAAVSLGYGYTYVAHPMLSVI